MHQELSYHIYLKWILERHLMTHNLLSLRYKIITLHKPYLNFGHTFIQGRGDKVQGACDDYPNDVIMA